MRAGSGRGGWLVWYLNEEGTMTAAEEYDLVVPGQWSTRRGRVRSWVTD
ncbi:MAG TPA: hypothetical protein VGZ22_22595 [Isosphaeraceae bacterium]|jgi:hypothetical protein|nr:hypothetical protein [Isosphaeraceae bacterium]